MVTVQPYLGAEQVVTVPHDQFHAVPVSAGELAFSVPTAQADVPVGSGSCGVVPLPVPQASASGVTHTPFMSVCGAVQVVQSGGLVAPFVQVVTDDNPAWHEAYLLYPMQFQIHLIADSSVVQLVIVLQL